MIFVTVGEQLPFDRLICSIDNWASTSSEKVFAQIGDTELIPKNFKYKHFLDPVEFQEKIVMSDLIIAHAGMGTIISALEFRKPIIVMPRKSGLGEHRNDHQLATANRFKNLNNILVASDETDLFYKLNNINILFSTLIKSEINRPTNLINSIYNFINK